MQLYGYTEAGRQADHPVPLTLAEATLCASPDQLRRIAAFLEHAAREMERMGAAYGHLHLADWDRAFEEAPQFVVCGPGA
jgi:hypothetical protein